MMIPYCTDRNIDTNAVYLAHALFNSTNGFTKSTNLSSASLNRLFREYASPPCLNSSSPPCRQPACRHSCSSNLDLEACQKYGYYFNVQLEYNLEMGVSDISPSWCFTIGGDLWRFISTQLSVARTFKGRKSLQGSCTP